MKVPFTKPTSAEEKKLQQDLADKIKKDMEDCDGDWLQYIKKHNRHTLSISLRNEQTGEVFDNTHYFTLIGQLSTHFIYLSYKIYFSNGLIIRVLERKKRFIKNIFTLLHNNLNKKTSLK